MDYCSVSDVLRIAKVFSVDAQNDGYGGTGITIPTVDIEAAISQASDLVRATLRTKFDIATIESYDPIPLTIITFTATEAAILLLDREGPISTERNKGLQSMLYDNCSTYKRRISRGYLLDDVGIPIQTIKDRQSSIQQKSDTEEVNTFYEEIPNGYNRYW